MIAGLPISHLDVIVWLLITNALTYMMFAADKKASRVNARRISERMLLIWCAAGGSPAGYYAMKRLRHKTQKASFQQGFWTIVVLQMGALLWYAYELF